MAKRSAPRRWAASPSTLAGPDGSKPGSWVQCKLCGKRFASARGLSQHERKEHPEHYHSANIPKVVREGWSNDECVLVAREELRLVREGYKRGSTRRVNVNADLCRAFPQRSMDSIKGLRKNLKYLSLRTRLADEELVCPPDETPSHLIGFSA